MRYYRLRDDIDFPRRWHLGDILLNDNWKFTDPGAHEMEPGKYRMEVFQQGQAMDFTLSEAYGVPVLSQNAADALVGLPEIDEEFYHTVLSPVEIIGSEPSQSHFVMITETQLDCVDRTRSEFHLYETDDPVRPDRAGEYRGFFNLVVDPELAQDRNILRLKGHLGSLVVSEAVKDRFEAAGVTGAVFDPVNGEGTVVA